MSYLPNCNWLFPSIMMRNNSTIIQHFPLRLTWLYATSWHLKVTRLQPNLQENTAFKKYTNPFGVTYKEGKKIRKKKKRNKQWSRVNHLCILEGYIMETCIPTTCLLRTRAQGTTTYATASLPFTKIKCIEQTQMIHF